MYLWGDIRIHDVVLKRRYMKQCVKNSRVLFCQWHHEREKYIVVLIVPKKTADYVISERNIFSRNVTRKCENLACIVPRAVILDQVLVDNFWRTSHIDKLQKGMCGTMQRLLIDIVRSQCWILLRCIFINKFYGSNSHADVFNVTIHFMMNWQ